MKILVLLYGWSRANRKCKSHRAQTTHCYWLGIVGCGIVRDTGLTVSRFVHESTVYLALARFRANREGAKFCTFPVKSHTAQITQCYLVGIVGSGSVGHRFTSITNLTRLS